MSGALTSTSEGSTLILTLSDPAHKNALGPDIYAAGIEAMNAAENNPEIRSVVITGEGRIDSQTVHGKVPVGVARVAKRYNLPVIGIAGSLTPDVGIVHQHGLDAVFSVIYSICTLDEALENAAENVRMTARNVAAVLKMGRLL